MKQERLKNGIERLLFLPMRQRHRAAARKKYEARTETIDSVRRFLSRAAEIKSEKIKKVYNVVFYTLLVDQDLADFTDSLIFATGDRRRAFFAKHEAVLIYEAAEDVRQMLGRDFRNAIKSFGITDEQFTKVKAACSALNRFWDDHHQFLNSIRNVLAAHREHDALHYVATLELVKPLEVMTRAAEFSQRLEHLLIALTPILQLTADPA